MKVAEQMHMIKEFGRIVEQHKTGREFMEVITVE